MIQGGFKEVRPLSIKGVSFVCTFRHRIHKLIVLTPGSVTAAQHIFSDLCFPYLRLFMKLWHFRYFRRTNQIKL